MSHRKTVEGRVVRLYHFTCLAFLPEIMRDGITQGEVPIGPVPCADRPQAANLTTNPNPNVLQSWNVCTFDKTRIRLTVDIPESELTSFREVKERYKIKASWLKLIAPYHVRQQWFYAFGGVRPDQITLFEKLDNGEYVVVDDLQSLIEEIESELERALVFSVVTSGFSKGARRWELKPDVEDTWLFDASDDNWNRMVARRVHPVPSGRVCRGRRCG